MTATLTSGIDGDPVTRLLVEFQRAAQTVVPRLRRIMPEAYFQQTPTEEQDAHARALIAAEAGGLPQAIALRSADDTRYTYINSRSYPGMLEQLLGQLPTALPLRSARAYTSLDRSLVLDVFEFGTARSKPQPVDEVKMAEVQAFAARHWPQIAASQVSQHLREASPHYLANVSNESICRHLLMIQQVGDSEDTSMDLRRRTDDSTSIAMVFGRADRRRMFERVAGFLGRHGVDIEQAFLNEFSGCQGQPLSLLTFVVRLEDRQGLDPDSPLAQQLHDHLPRLKHLDDEVLKLSTRWNELDLFDAEVAIALSHLAHQVLSARNAALFTRQYIVESLSQYPDLSLCALRMFRARFDPVGQHTPTAQADWAQRFEALKQRANTEARHEDARTLLATWLDALGAVERTNGFVATRYALALRVNPNFLQPVTEAERPFAVFFLYGREFDGFHVRFRDISRGGLRIVRTATTEHHILESNRLYKEAYGLAAAQQLKNKDIAEGGSKGVILTHPESSTEHWGRAYVDSLLDLITPEPNTKALIVDWSNATDWLYLGPDENVSNEFINWTVARAAARGYPQPNAFMSSKPSIGINHKQYGITSEGVTVFLEAALVASGIDPRQQPFTVKLTGGPDGDVAGNEIRILHREFGDNARIVGIADGSGCAEDPTGLSHQELLRLVHQNLPIAHFNPQCLSPTGRIHTVTTPEGLLARNSLHNRIESDAFVPAGGRPHTIHGGNWKAYLTPKGLLSSRVVVEGANLFFSPEARRQLAAYGLLCVKDSSANKCGVICSSLEILASMLLSEEQFLLRKEQLVGQILETLRELSSLEAELLFREKRHRPDSSLPDLSSRISQTINAATDAVCGEMLQLRQNEPELLDWFLRRHLPASLTQSLPRETLLSLPEAYVDRTLAAMLTSRIIYREGLNYFEGMQATAVANLAVRYLREDRTAEGYALAVERSQLVNCQAMAKLLRSTGAGALVRAGQQPL